jgi:hypothetical protein
MRRRARRCGANVRCGCVAGTRVVEKMPVSDPRYSADMPRLVVASPQIRPAQELGAAAFAGADVAGDADDVDEPEEDEPEDADPDDDASDEDEDEDEPESDEVDDAVEADEPDSDFAVVEPDFFDDLLSVR